MIKSRLVNEAAALRELALNDIDRASEEDLCNEAKEDKLEFQDFAERVRAAMREAAASVLREQLDAKSPAAPSIGRSSAVSAVKPSIEQMKMAIKKLFAQQPDLRLAFRSGSRLPDTDVASMYDDLVNVGAIKLDGSDPH